MALSSKQLGMAWINSKLDPTRIDPSEEELQDLNGGKPVSEKTLEGAKSFIIENLGKLRQTKYQPYVDKYCNLKGTTNAEDGTEESADSSGVSAPE